MSDVVLKTTPRDPRFPNTNQYQHCWTRYNEWILCLKRTGEDEDACKQSLHFARSLCPNAVIEAWDEQRENGQFPGLSLNDEE
mmetsp:Transcript_13262/g.22803  ORF Transcript_13262/g.22803 Transcript_13262/m.22803 type:complete len:83 (-) Transcript_13262:122-370(-)